MLRDAAARQKIWLQEVVLKAWRFLSAFRADSSFRTWLIRVAINEVLQFQRREHRASRFHEPSDHQVKFILEKNLPSSASPECKERKRFVRASTHSPPNIAWS